MIELSIGDLVVWRHFGPDGAGVSDFGRWGVGVYLGRQHWDTHHVIYWGAMESLANSGWKSGSRVHITDDEGIKAFILVSRFREVMG